MGEKIKLFIREQHRRRRKIESEDSITHIFFSVVEDALGKESNDLQRYSFGEIGNYYFVLVNTKDYDVQSKSLIQFFEMPRHEAIKALNIYKRDGMQVGSLSDFYQVFTFWFSERDQMFLLLKTSK